MVVRNTPWSPVQFGTPPTFFCSYDQCLCLRYCLKSLGSTIRKVPDFSFECEPIRHDQHRSRCPPVCYSLLDPLVLHFSEKRLTPY